MLYSSQLIWGHIHISKQSGLSHQIYVTLDRLQNKLMIGKMRDNRNTSPIYIHIYRYMYIYICIYIYIFISIYQCQLFLFYVFYFSFWCTSYIFQCLLLGTLLSLVSPVYFHFPVCCLPTDSVVTATRSTGFHWSVVHVKIKSLFVENTLRSFYTVDMLWYNYIHKTFLDKHSIKV